MPASTPTPVAGTAAAPRPGPAPSRRPSCFVVQGFGRKTDYTAGRVLDLDASYAVIREAVRDAGLDCLRCDEVVHAGLIDAPMYEQLMRADLVIADLSTYNINAAFELGVRYGLRPYATIIVAEEGFSQPFDVSHSVIRRYRHLGEDIGAREAARFRAELAAAIREIVDRRQPDSPVYTFLGRLVPPSERMEQALEAAAREVDTAAAAPDGAGAPPAAGAAKLLREQALALINPPPGCKSDFAGARELLRLVVSQSATANPGNPSDPSVVQQLALATYKAEQPTPLQALLDAREVLRPLQPATTNDPETLGLWGAVHKRLWDRRGEPGAPADAGQALSEAIAAHTRGFYLKQDHYNGVNLAFLLELRALGHARAGDRDDAVADRVLARRTREELLGYVAPRVAELAELAQGEHHDAERYWLAASLWETAAGLGRADEAARREREARALAPPGWMLESTEAQVTRLRAQQAELAGLLAASAAPPTEPAAVPVQAPAAPPAAAPAGGTTAA